MDSSVFVPDAFELARTLRGATAADVVLIVQQYLRTGGARTAVAVCEAARALGLEDPALVVSESMARFAAGERAQASALLESLLAASPGHLAAMHVHAHMLLSLGRASEGRALLGRVVDAFPDFPGAQGALSALLMPGPAYRDVIARVHRLARPETYLEIGVETGATLALATTARIAVGVDPAEAPLEVALPRGARVFRMESDAFFARETLRGVFEGRPVQLAFIDGMHWFEYALRDFVNVERWSSKDGTIVLHDCLPVSKVAALRERASTFWVGDVWKVLEVLLDYRPDLRVRVVPAAPSGLVVVRGLDPESTVISRAMDEILSRYAPLSYPHVPGEWPERYGVVTNDEAGLARALGT
jgi:hypothetical protein